MRRRNQRRDKSYIGCMVDADKEWMAYEREVEARSNQLSQRLVQLLEGVLAEAHIYNQIHAAEADRNERRLQNQISVATREYPSIHHGMKAIHRTFDIECKRNRMKVIESENDGRRLNSSKRMVLG